MSNTVVVFGASCETGVEMCRRFRENQDTVIAIARASSETENLAGLGVEIRTADALDRDAVFQGTKDLPEGTIFVSFLGRPLTRKTGVDIDGNSNVIDAAVAVNAGRFVLVSSIGAGNSAKAMGFMNKLIIGRLVKEKALAEEHLVKQSIPWTIIRPGALMRIKDPTGDAFLIENPLTIGSVNRTDLGELVYQAALSDAAAGKFFNALDKSDSKVVSGTGDLTPARF